MVATSHDVTARPKERRADSVRNRQILIDAAAIAFKELGPEVSLEMIARRAGLGKGTLYRHFPVRDALIEAVCRSELEQMAAAAHELLETHSPADALHLWMRLYVEFIATNKVMAAAVSSICGMSQPSYRSSVAQITDNPVLGATSDFYRSVTDLVSAAATLLLSRAQACGEIRGDIDVANLLRAIGGFTVTYGEDQSDWESGALSLIEIFMDGLRRRS